MYAYCLLLIDMYMRMSTSEYQYYYSIYVHETNFPFILNIFFPFLILGRGQFVDVVEKDRKIIAPLSQNENNNQFK